MTLLTSIARRLGVALLVCAIAIGTLILAAPAAQAESHTVEMTSLLKFSPDTVTAKPGDTIVWQNNAGLPHNVVLENASKFDASAAKSLGKMLGKGSTELTLPADFPVGTYTYYCAPHRGAGMAGKIVVQ